jgi:hypothetical protein
MIRKLWSMRFMLLTFIMLLVYAESFAQTLTTDAPAPQKAWEIFLKIVFPALWTGVAPYVTGLVTMGISHVPAPLRVVISSVLGAVMAGAAGAIPDFPLTIESAATMGLAGGATGQVLANMNPDTLKPKTEAAIAVIETNKKVS